MSRSKLKKFDKLKEMDHVIQPDREELMNDNFPLKGNWSKKFKNNNPIILELGCGKGEYSVSLAKIFPNYNYIGIDIKGARIFSGADLACKEKLNNVCFIRTQIEYIDSLFSVEEVSEIWITFPDPQLKKRRETKRLTHPNFLKSYKNILKKDASIHLKTDSQFLHGFTLGVIASAKHFLEDSTHDLYDSSVSRDHMEIKTHYEQIYLDKGMPITYLRFRLKQ